MEIFIEDCTKLSVSLPFDFLILREPHDVEIKRIKQALDFHETDPAKQCVVPVVVPTARYDVVPYWFERQLKTFGRSFTDEVCGWQAKNKLIDCSTCWNFGEIKIESLSLKTQFVWIEKCGVVLTRYMEPLMVLKISKDSMF